jgi:hypothetical protein
LANGAAAVVTPILATRTPVVTSILATGTPVITSISAVAAPVLASVHPDRLSLGIRSRQRRSWHCHANRRAQSQNPKGSSTRDCCCL